ncbi:TPA: hypothetical protein I8Y21_004472 [Klebsiella oxytoca]|uniref:Uncharacterized protein n=1 Tax=Klebsiella oxytoca TaxID=571 RepID=A0AAN5RFF3_KLEOX|nr:hypothetical protein [Klebsiella oxytoca]
MMFMLLLSGNRYDPATFIRVKQIYGTTLNSAGQAVPVKSLYGDIISGGNTLSIPVKALNGSVISGGNTLSVPVRNVYGFLLVTY